MNKEGFSIQKFVGVTPAQLATLHTVLISDVVRKKGYIPGEGEFRQVFAELKTVSWDTLFETLTIEISVYDYAKWYRGLGGNRVWHTFNEHSKTGREVLTAIYDALERFDGSK